MKFKNHIKIREIEDQGYQVEVRHFRRITSSPGTLPASVMRRLKMKPYPRGGFTEVQILSGDELLGLARSECSGKDNFNKKTGLSIALGRALKEMEAN